MKKGVANMILALMLALLTVSFSAAQTDPAYSRNIFNMQMANPAYAGTWAGTGYLVNIRKQWIGIEGAPFTQAFTFQKQHYKQYIGWGFSILHDQLGLEKRLAFFGDYSYRIELDWKSYLYFGLKAGFTNYVNNLNDYTIYDPDHPVDPVFQGVIHRYFVPNFGVGLLLQSEIWQVGISVPKIIQLEYDSNVTDVNSYSELRHFFFSGSYIFDLKHGYFLKPSLQLLVVKGAPLELGASLDLLFFKKMWLGGFYRYNETAGVTAQWIFSKKMRFGYSYEFPVTDLARHQFGTHEVMFSYELNFTRNNRYNFRFF